MSIFSTITHRHGTPLGLGKKAKIVGAVVLAGTLLSVGAPSAAVAQTPDLSGVAANAQRLIDAATGDHDAYARLSWTLAVSDRIAFTPFVGTSLSLDSGGPGSNYLWGGLWFEVNF